MRAGVTERAAPPFSVAFLHAFFVQKAFNPHYSLKQLLMNPASPAFRDNENMSGATSSFTVCARWT